MKISSTKETNFCGAGYVESFVLRSTRIFTSPFITVHTSRDGVAEAEGQQQPWLFSFAKIPLQ